MRRGVRALLAIPFPERDDNIPLHHGQAGRDREGPVQLSKSLSLSLAPNTAAQPPQEMTGTPGQGCWYIYAASRSCAFNHLAPRLRMRLAATCRACGAWRHSLALVAMMRGS